jgi:very-short-patch-repair endonuclease
VLACGPEAVLSHASAAALWAIAALACERIEVSVPGNRCPRPAGVLVHRRSNLRRCDLARRDGIPVTSAACTLIDLAPRLRLSALEAAVNEADRLDLVDPERLRRFATCAPRRPGLPAVRAVLDRRTFALTDSELERRFRRPVRAAGLPQPLTQAWLNGFRVDFHWPDLGLVVETDALRYHRTPGRQAADRARDQVHAAAGLTCLRFTHAQVCYEPGRVASVLAAVISRLAEGGRSASPRSGSGA